MSGRKRPWQDIGASGPGDDGYGDERMAEAELARWNGVVERAMVGDGDALAQFASSAPVADWWQAWLWGADPMEATTVAAPFNLCQLNGLLLCRSLPLQGVVCRQTLGALLPSSPTLTSVCHDVQVSSMNIRHLRDSIQSNRVGWVAAKAWEIDGIEDCLIHLASRLGVVSSTAIPDGDIHDDEAVEPIPGAKGFNRVTRAATRRPLNVLMVLLRSVRIHSIAQAPEEGEAEGVQRIQRHHTLAGEDEFHGLSMHWDMPSAEVLNYAHQFVGMLTSVSQVAFFMDPSYRKRNPRSKEVAAIAAGELGPLYTLPSVLQMYPEIPVVQPDGVLRFGSPGDREPPRWLMMDQDVMLLAGDGTVFSHPNIIPLVHQLQRVISRGGFKMPEVAVEQ